MEVKKSYVTPEVVELGEHREIVLFRTNMGNGDGSIILGMVNS